MPRKKNVTAAAETHQPAGSMSPTGICQMLWVVSWCSKLQIMKMIKSYYISLTRIICWLVFVLCAWIYAMYIVRNSDVTRSGSRSQPAWGQLPTQRMLRGLWLQKHGLVWESCRLTCQLISGRTQISKDLGYLGVKGRGASGIAHSSF